MELRLGPANQKQTYAQDWKKEKFVDAKPDKRRHHYPCSAKNDAKGMTEQMVREIVLPDTKPEMEWIGDRPVQKMSPTRKHSKLQAAFVRVLEDWASDRGDVGPEWRFRAAPPGEDIHPLVPDVAYMSYDRLRPLSVKDREFPPVAPEIVVEILSPDDRQKDVDEKRRVYFAWGVLLELIADPDERTLDVYDSDGNHERIHVERESRALLYAPKSMPDLQLPLRAMFAKIDIPE